MTHNPEEMKDKAEGAGLVARGTAPGSGQGHP